jgi:hypothetical protein
MNNSALGSIRLSLWDEVSISVGQMSDELDLRNKVKLEPNRPQYHKVKPVAGVASKFRLINASRII